MLKGVCLLTVLLLSQPFGALAAEPSELAIRLETLATNSRLYFQVDEGVDIDWKNVPGGFEIFFKQLTLMDLGAPFGQEKAWVAQFSEIHDERLESLSIEEKTGGLKVTGRWKFTVGNNAPAHPEMERFDYRQKSPPGYVIDFWVKKGPTVSQALKKKKEAEREVAFKKSQAEATLRAEKRALAAKQKEQATDLGRFCREPLNESEELFLHFKPAHVPVDFSRWTSRTTPDKDYSYYVPKGSSREHQYVRLAVEFYSLARPGLAIRVIEFFNEEYPKSIFNDEIKFLKANSLVKLSLHIEAEKIFRELMLEKKESPAAIHAGIFLGVQAFNQGQYIEALEHFLWLIRNSPMHQMNWLFHLGAAESLSALGQTSRSSMEYQWVVERAPDRKIQAEAGLRMGDLYIGRRQYAQALSSYYRALQAFSDEAKHFPLVFLNRAESLYWLAEHERAEEAYLGFLEHNGANPAAWRATFRLAEIYGRRVGDENRKKYREWLYKTINGYPFSPGATLARLRLLPCDDHGGFTYDSAKKFFDGEIVSFDDQGEIDLKPFGEFVTVTRVRSFITLGHEEEAISVISLALGSHISEPTRNLLSKTFKTLFRKVIVGLMSVGKKYDALVLFTKHEQRFKQLGESEFPDFIMDLANAAAEMRLGALSVRLLAQYRDMAGSGNTKGRIVASDPNDIDSKIKASGEAYAEAKSLWLVSGMKAEGDIRAMLEKVVPESSACFGKEVILGQIEQTKGDLSQALKHAVRAQLLSSDLDQMSRDQITYWAAKLYRASGETASAVTLLRDLMRTRNLASAKELISISPIDGLAAAPTRRTLALELGDALENMRRWEDATDTYSKVIDWGEQDNQVLFSYARSLDRQGSSENRAKAQATLEQITKSETQDFWRRMAAETLERQTKLNFLTQ